MYKNEIRICEHCNKEYLGDKTRKYCSYDCSHGSRQRRLIKNCIECGKEYWIQEWQKDENKYCSYKCKYLNNSSDIVKTNCTNCGKEFERKSHRLNTKNRFCTRDCLLEYNRGANHYEYKEHLHDKHIKLALKQWGRAIKKRDNYICMRCGCKEKCILEAHHIKPRSTFPETMFEMDNGQTLCIYCHLNEHLDDNRAYRIILVKIKNYELQLVS